MFDGLLRFLTGVDDNRQSGERDVPPSPCRAADRSCPQRRPSRGSRTGHNRAPRPALRRTNEVTHLMKVAEEERSRRSISIVYPDGRLEFSEGRTSASSRCCGVAYWMVLTGDQVRLIRRVAGLIYGVGLGRAGKLGHRIGRWWPAIERVTRTRSTPSAGLEQGWQRTT
jgi:hypothetical protein